MPNNSFSIKPLKVRLLAGEQKATEKHTHSLRCPSRRACVARIIWQWAQDEDPSFSKPQLSSSPPIGLLAYWRRLTILVLLYPVSTGCEGYINLKIIMVGPQSVFGTPPFNYRSSRCALHAMMPHLDRFRLRGDARSTHPASAAPSVCPCRALRGDTAFAHSGTHIFVIHFCVWQPKA